MPDQTRILTFSDINWSPRNQGTTLNEIIALIEHVEPALILLPGDLLDDKRISKADQNTYWQEIGKLLDFFEKSQLRCYLVKGNRDNRPEYDQLMARQYAYVEDISEKIAETNGLRVLGVSHAFTDSLPTMRGIRQRYPDPVDIILAHAEGRRRIWLYEMPSRLIITGHFDEKFCAIRDKFFCSFWNFPGHYAVIDYQPDDVALTYFTHEVSYDLAPAFYDMHTEPKQYKAQLTNGKPTWLTDQPEAWARYGRQMEALLTLKEQVGQLSVEEKREGILRLLELGVYKAHILEYIPGAYGILKTR